MLNNNQLSLKKQGLDAAKQRVEEAKNEFGKVIKRALDCVNEQPNLEQPKDSATDTANTFKDTRNDQATIISFAVHKMGCQMEKKLSISKTACGSTKLSPGVPQAYVIGQR